ncbi:MAG TPA: bifunctional nuclease domain-containing protein [Acidimicrobiales bacterium]
MSGDAVSSEHRDPATKEPSEVPDEPIHAAAEAPADADEVGDASSDAAVDAPGEREEEFSPTPYVPMEYVDVVMALPAANPILVLREIAGLHRELHIPIAFADGVAIAYAAQQIETPRPLTHELITNMLDAFALTLETVRITQVVGTSFSAELILTGLSGMRVLECRISDGVCLALRQRLPVPVTADSLVLFHAGAPMSLS